MVICQLTIEPESKYTSLLNFELIIHYEEKDSHVNLKFPVQYKIANCEMDGLNDSSSALTFDTNENILKIKNMSNQSQIILKGRLAHATDDSGASLYPYVTSCIKFHCEVDGIDNLFLMVVLPIGAAPYSGFVNAKINEQKFVWERTQKSGKEEIKYFSRGDGKTIQSVLGLESHNGSGTFKVSLNIPFRIRSVRLPFVSLLPVLVGMPLMIIWGLPDSEFTLLSKMSSSLAAVPVLFAICQRSTEASLDPFDFLNATWLVSVGLWLSYAAVFQVSGIWVTTEISGMLLLCPYFAWIIYHIALLVWFRNNPTRRDPIPKLFYVFVKFRRKLVRVQDELTHKGGFYEPEAV